MDRFVIRSPTWKTLNYSSMAAQAVSQKGSLTKKKPVQKKLLDKVLIHPCNFDKGDGNLLSPSNLLNLENNANSNDSGLSSASSVSPQLMEENSVDYNDASYKHTESHLNNLDDYIDCQVGKENAIYLAITHTPKSSHKKVVEPCQQVQKPLAVNRVINTQDKPFHTACNRIMTRIQKDLNSPSAAARMKAINAMKSPTKSAYAHFDIPDVEQSFRLPDPPSLKEIMGNIVAYVEVRSGEDNRSAGVRKVIEAMGARISLSLNRETTHVIFKDGLLSTFKKATQMKLPIVSILWIEACKNQRRICDPKDFPISNLDRYENPELYTKMKRLKSMQPDSECNKRRVRCKAGGTPKDSTPTQKTNNLKKTSTLIGGTPTSSTNKKKTDISQFFKKIGSPLPSSATKVDNDRNGTPTIPESPATQLLSRIHSEFFTPLDVLKKKTGAKENNNIQNSNEDSFESVANVAADDDKRNIVASVRSNMVAEMKTTIDAAVSPVSNRRGRPRRHSNMEDCEIETTTRSMNTMAISISTPITPVKSKNRRRSSIHTPKDMSMTAEVVSNASNIPSIPEECNEVEKEHDTPQKRVNRRRTLYTVQTMDQKDAIKSTTNNETEPFTIKSLRRRTLYANETMETSNVKPVQQNQITESTENITIQQISHNSKNLDATNETEMNTPSLTNYRRTLYDAQTISESNITTLKNSVTTGGSVCLTPINFQMGKVASSTLLDDTASRSTPPAGKLLEETEECTTPLTFSSIRPPGNKRRSLFDVSMDIITQRLQCINQSARRSLAPPTPSAEVVNTLEQHINTPIGIKKSNNFFLTSETLSESSNSCDGIAVGVITPEVNKLKKKRKLFMPNEMLVTPKTTAPAPTGAVAITQTAAKNSEESVVLVSSASNNTTSNSVTKRRRTLMPISQPQPTTVTLKDSISNSGRTPIVRKRRSTLDFEQTQNIERTNINSNADSTTVNACATKNVSQQNKAKNNLVLVYTNMHQQQIDVIREAIDKLGLFVLASCVTDATTHLVSLEPRRTLNLLKALARGLWILDYSWIVESLKAGKWLPEESHELKRFSRAIEICRSERQAFGNKYKCDLFHKFGSFYISSQCCPISKENMRELITLCGGHVVHVRQKARYIIGDANRTLEDKLYLTPYWVLDSITQMQLMKVNKYMYRLPNAKSASQPLPLEKAH